MADEVARALLVLETQLDDRGVQQAVNRLNARIQESFSGVERSAGRVQNLFDRGLNRTLAGTAQVFKTVGAVGGAAIGGVLAQSVAAGVSFNALNQRVTAALTALLKGGDKAKALLTEVNALVDNSPFAREIFLQATQQLVGFGVEASKVVPILDAVQQAAAGISGGNQAVQDFADIFATIAAQGRITAREIERFGVRGVDAAGILTDAFGVAREEISSLSESEVTDALIRGLQEQFGGATEALGNTLDKANDRLNAARRALGTVLATPFVDPVAGGKGVDLINELANVIRQVARLATPLQPVLTQIGQSLVNTAKQVTAFLKTIEESQITSFIDRLREIAPIAIAVAGALGGMLTTLVQGIPVIGQYIPVLNPVVAAFVGLGLAIPEVREQLLSIGATLIATLKPAFDTIMGVLPTVIDLIGNIAQGVGPALRNLIITISPAVIVLANAFALLVNILRPITELLKFPGVQAIITVILARLLAGAVQGSAAFRQMSASITGAINSLRQLGGQATATAAQVRAAGAASQTAFTGGNAAAIQQSGANFAAAAAQARGLGTAATQTATKVGGLAGIFSRVGGLAGGLRGAIGGLAGGLAGLINPVNIAIVGFTQLANSIASAQQKGKEGVGKLLEGFDTSSLEGSKNALAELNKELEKQQKINNKGSLTIFGKLKIAPLNSDLNKSAGAIKELNKQIADLEGRTNVFDGIQKAIAQNTGKPIAEVAAALEEGGVAIESFRLGEANKLIDQFTQKLGGMANSALAAKPSLKALQDQLTGLKSALQESIDAGQQQFSGVFAAGERVKSANSAVDSARQGEAEAARRINDLIAERAKIIQDTVTPAQEIAKAERDLELAARRVASVDREILQTQQQLAKLRDPALRAEQEAAADREVLRAKLAVNAARRAELELQKEVNKESVPQVNLAGLTLDQARNKLAAVRSTLAAQKQGDSATTSTAKTQEELEDEKLSKRLDVLDAEQRLRETERGRAEFTNNQNIAIQEAETRLLELQNQKQEALLAQTTSQTHLNDLRQGETTLARNLRQIDEQIAEAKRAQTRAAEATRAAVQQARDAERELAIESAKVTKDVERQALLVGEMLREQGQRLNLEPQVLAKINETTNGFQNQINKIRELNGEIARFNQAANFSFSASGLSGNSPLSQQIPALTEAINKLAETAEGSALATQALLANQGINVPMLPRADGGILTKPTWPILAGEAGAELILPLTRPNRVWELLSQHLPKYPGALAAAQSAVSPVVGSSPSVMSKLITGSGGNAASSRAAAKQANRDLAEAIAEALLAKGFKPGQDVHIEAPVTIQGQLNEELFARRMEQRIEKMIERKLR